MKKSVTKLGEALNLGNGGRILLLLLRLEVLQEVVQLLGLLAELLDDNTRARNNLPGVGVLVQLAETSPFAQLLAIGDGHQLDVGVLAKSLDQVNVGGFVALGEGRKRVRGF